MTTPYEAMQESRARESKARAWAADRQAYFVRPLNRVTTDFERGEFGSDMLIRKADDADVQRLQATSPFSGLGLSRLEAGDMVLECLIQAETPEEGQQTANEKFQRVLLAFRLLREGAVTLGEQVAYQRDGFLDRPSFPYPLLGDWGFLFGGEYYLSEADLDTLGRLYERLPRAPRAAAVALRRFDLAYRRQSREDRLIDWWVGLEALFGDRQGEITYKLSLRVAYFVAGAEERAELARLVRKAYDTRSAVIHGGGSDDKIREFETVSGNLLRRALRKIVLFGSLPAAAALDDMIAAGTSE